jgi:hypothetical protein
MKVYFWFIIRASIPLAPCIRPGAAPAAIEQVFQRQHRVLQDKHVQRQHRLLLETDPSRKAKAAVEQMRPGTATAAVGKTSSGSTVCCRTDRSRQLTVKRDHFLKEVKCD